MKHLLLSSAAAVALTVASPAFAGTITLDFAGLSNAATDAQVQTYLDGLLPSGDSVVVTGAAGSCNTGGNGCPYQADGHIVGPVSGTTVTSLTLGGLPTPTTFIGTGGDFVVGGANQITMTFSGPDFSGSNALSGIAFNYEIFPDDSCTALNAANCGGTGNPNRPDLDVLAGTTSIAQYFGNTPSSPYTHSPDSGAFSNELAPQLIGSANLSIPAGDTELTFADWPAGIGIDNLVLTTGACTSGTSGCNTNTTVPEPGTMPLLSAFLALGGLAFGRRSVKQIKDNLGFKRASLTLPSSPGR